MSQCVFTGPLLCGPHRKHLSVLPRVVMAACLLVRYPAKDALYCRLLLYVLPSNGCLPRICLRGNIFIEPLPSSGSIRHSICLILFACERNVLFDSPHILIFKIRNTTMNSEDLKGKGPVIFPETAPIFIWNDWVQPGILSVKIKVTRPRF
jgi:hypothetical protein